MAVNVGIVGAGVMGADHATTLHRFVAGARLAAVADIDPGRAEVVANRCGGARVLKTAPELIDNPGVDAVIVASHDSTHAELTLACLRAGKPVLCEKPLAPTVAECADIVRAQGDRHLVKVGFMRRFDPRLRPTARRRRVLLRTASGVLCTVEVFLNARYGYDMRCEVVCETGALALAEPAAVVRDTALTHGIGYAPDWRPRFAEAYRLELRAWIDSIVDGTPERALATADDGLRASAVADAVRASMRQGGNTVAVTGV